MTRDDIIRIAQECQLIGMRPHLDGIYQESLERFAALAAAAEREKVAAWMRSKSYATGHGDTVEDLLKELEWQVAERERKACAKVCEAAAKALEINKEDIEPMPRTVAIQCAAAIRARGKT